MFGKIRYHRQNPIKGNYNANGSERVVEDNIKKLVYHYFE